MNAIPRGAIDITVTGVARRDDAPTIAFVLREKGPNARIPPHAEALLAGLPESGVVDAHAAQTLRGSCGAGGGRSVLSVAGDEVIIRAASDADQDRHARARAAQAPAYSMLHI